MNFKKMYRTDVVNLVQSPMEDGRLKLLHYLLNHLNVKGVHMLQNMVSDMIIDKRSYHISLLLCEACIKDKTT